MANEIFKLRKEHVNFKKLLDLLDAQLDLLHQGKAPDYQLMTDIVYYMTQYADLIHHPREEAIFALLAVRDSSVVENVTELTGQHHMLAESGARFHEKHDRIISEAIEDRFHLVCDQLVRLSSDK
jgi:hemerythrin-like domain-containing protein